MRFPCMELGERVWTDEVVKWWMEAYVCGGYGKSENGMGMKRVVAMGVMDK